MLVSLVVCVGSFLGLDVGAPDLIQTVLLIGFFGGGACTIGFALSAVSALMGYRLGIIQAVIAGGIFALIIRVALLSLLGADSPS